MPAYRGADFLQNDEWILLQIKEGPCSAGCDYCYENSHLRKVLTSSPSLKGVDLPELDQLSTLQLSRLADKHGQSLNLEMQVDELKTIFSILNEANIRRVGLIGSEPSTHSRFHDILGLAQEHGIDLLIYTAGFALQKLNHAAVKYVVLHLDYGRLDQKEMSRRLDLGLLPSPSYMKEVVSLLNYGKEIHLRINFASTAMTEARLVDNFFSRIPNGLRAQTRLKYSFNTRVDGDSAIGFETPETLREGSKVIFDFIDRFIEQFPEVMLVSERPLFPCAFNEQVWNKYAKVGGFLSSCDMEFTFYPATGLALCPPSRELTAPKLIRNADELKRRLVELRMTLEDLYHIPSFKECEPCERRTNLSCQGGCLGYKVGQMDVGATRTTP